MTDVNLSDVNSMISEESRVAVIDGESTDKNIPKNDNEDPKVGEHRQTIANYFDFVATVEETKMLEKHKKGCTKPCFVKDFDDDNKEDWTENHFFHRDGEEKDACKVFFTSYQVKRVIENASRADHYFDKNPIEVNETEGSAGFYYVQAQKPSNVLPVPNIEGGVREYLEFYKLNTPNSFNENTALEDILETISEKDLNADPETAQFARTYRKALVDRDLKKMFKPLYDWQAGNLDKSRYELRLGLGHVRKIYERRNGVKRILNAPLIEVPVQVDEESLKVVPVQGGRFKWNGEAKDVLLFTGGKNKNTLADFQTLIANGDPMKVVLGNPKTFLEYIEKASLFSWDDVVKDHKDDFLHAFTENSEASVLTTEWCIFVREKRSNIISTDAHAIAKAIEETDLKISSPCYSLVLLPEDVQPKYSKSDSEDDKFVLPLPASNGQMEVIKNVFAKDNPVSIIQGPPGTGKTQTGVNIASISLQRGWNCLVTSDNPQALEAFEKKLPPDLAKFCTNLSTMQDGRIGKLSQCLDRREADIATLIEGKDYEKEKKILKKEIEDEESNRNEKMKQLRVDSENNRSFITKSKFSKLAQRGLIGDSNTCPYVKNILEHRDLENLKMDIEKLRNDKRVEKEELISFEFNGSGDISQDLLDFVEKKATMGTDFRDMPNKKIWEILSSFKVGEESKRPSNPVEWARVLRRLQLQKKVSDFQEGHVRLLEEKGCPESFIYTNDRDLSQTFVDAVNDIHESVEKSTHNELDGLLEALKDPRKNRKSQESVRESTIRIRKKREKLSHIAFALKQSELITAFDLGNFGRLKELASRMKDSEIDAMKGSDATLRRKAKFEDKFCKSLRCMPLLLLTTEQISRFIPKDYRFGMVIADEASQSPSTTALTILARAERAVIIGDTRQALPKDDLSEESRSALDKSKGGLELADLFMPGEGNSLFDVCHHKFPLNHKALRDHFRCPPDGMSWSNKEMYSGRLRMYKPSGTKTTLSLREGKNCKEEMVEFVVDKVKESISSDIQNHPVLTIGIIMMGPKSEANSFKKELEEKLAPLEDEYGTEAIERHCIKVAPPEEFQGQDKDIIVIGCLRDGKGKVPHETDPHRKRLWNVATTRHLRFSVIFSAYGPKAIKKDDPKKKIFFLYKSGEFNACADSFKKGNYDVRSLAENILFDELVSCGYEIGRNTATIWNGCLSIGLKNGSISDNDALIKIENYGETTEEWDKVVDEQADLEETGTSCLRVDALALSFRFHDVFDDIKAFLREKAGLYPKIADASASISDAIPEECNEEKPPSTKNQKRKSCKSLTRVSKRGKKSS